MAYNPKSLQNLKTVPFSKDTDHARKAQAKSVEARMANKAAREALKLTAAELKLDVDEVMETHKFGALDVLRLSMLKAIQAGDYEAAADLATKIAPYEAPKLQAIEQTNREVTADELSDEELDAKLREILGELK